MKQVICPECHDKKEIEDFVVISICPCCIERMIEVENEHN